MEQIQPWFYDQFQCIAQDCSDTCCAGWEVYIDPESLARYRADGSAFGVYRQSKIVSTQEGAMFALDGQERCPFLTEENLCTMILQEGPDTLCHICTHHPRFYKTYGPYDEQGIGLCCPEGSRLLLSQPLRFQRRHTPCDTPRDPVADTIFELRGLLQEVLLDGELSFVQRCEEALGIAQQAQAQLYGVAQAQRPWTGTKLQLWQALLTQMMTLLPINQGWQRYLETLQDHLPALAEKEVAFVQSDAWDGHQYGTMAAYILYRHFPDCLLDGQIVPRLTFALLSTYFVHLCCLQTWAERGILTQEDRAYHLKNWSKQVEYCDENTQLFLLACQENPALSNWPRARLSTPS